MRSEILAISSVRLFRLAVGTVLLVAGMALLAAQGLAWLNLEPRLLATLEGGAACDLGMQGRAGATPYSPSSNRLLISSTRPSSASCSPSPSVSK
ncbi:hypothetical protein SAMN05216593_108120 [Pseudomonas asturiensis]|uniref:Uncharacterized protein n=1 Tax=Pseudomonas asturiensis TaxID=1190415 RepID=A0A1M7P673_9PSED|nr:hypothetical protein SAMN05216593_108120 [Pseudomonas asturiensis]